MENNSPAAGDRVEARCGKCGDVRMHAVVAMVGSEIAKVQCLTCKGVHKYKSPKVEKAKAESGTTTRAKNPRPAAAAKSGATTSSRSAAAKSAAATRAAQAAKRQWEDKLGSRDQAKASPYSMTGTFAENELISHPTFGLGVVLTLIKPDKMEVMFEEGVKLLKCQI